MKTDLWHVGFLNRPITDLMVPGALAKSAITWLPLPGSFQFIADPFGIKTDEGLTIFVEYFDYRIKRGEIHYYSYDTTGALTARGDALVTPFHLSYPYLIQDDGVLYMLPEAHKSGVLTLYRCDHFPDRWTPVATLLDVPAIDATVVRHDGRWWMFYALPGPDGRAMRELHIAYADALMGPWRQHAGNPVRIGYESSRPGGNAFVHNGKLHLPMQDCVAHYGAAMNILRIDTLTPERFDAEPVGRLTAEGLMAGYTDGIHTLGGFGNTTFIDVKRIETSAKAHWIKLQHKLNRALGKR
ncbi:hypothetical protein [Asticcacaulis sp. 201]|uniref:glucosamine inositolphosphorylceramide transferase family protein n=1 Tax=Asticcacaulis sp. 201 TaxID=3028787 RepID=UPI002917118A|nr:hypothetical protein [Asticcacaulis sp. 201]MDV6332305.1 hypothetical protein [Asticcacaulis sp. 201]